MKVDGLTRLPGSVSRGRSSLEQIPWTTYFERELFLERPAGEGESESSIVHHAYLTSPVDKGPLFVMHHGAGSSGLSFAVLLSEIRKRLPSAGILSLDARGHGLTRVPGAMAASTASNGEDSGRLDDSIPRPTSGATAEAPDLTLSTLTADLLAVIELTRAQMHWPQLPPIVLVGHSLGGAVVTNLASSGDLGSALLGYAVLDVVEGSAIDALQSMHTYLSTRPAGFATLQAGIEWHVRSRTVRNAVSARTSVPALLVLDDSVDPTRPWRWRTDLAATQPFWEGWFVGLSRKFLEARGGKMLLLAGTDRLDTELTIGQMQGKIIPALIPSWLLFHVAAVVGARCSSSVLLTQPIVSLGKYALQVFPEAGHFIHEDLPEKTAIALVDFYRRNDRSALVLPPKVGDLLKQGKKV
jgi:protein phosphatase methylesterase 1